MFILFGWGFRTNKHFGTRKERCNICGGDEYSYYRIRTWFTLFFIPIIPYSTKYIMVCHRCGNSIELTSEQFFQELNEPLKPQYEEAVDITQSEPVKVYDRQHSYIDDEEETEVIETSED